jgi:hypothetical protein
MNVRQGENVAQGQKPQIILTGFECQGQSPDLPAAP